MTYQAKCIAVACALPLGIASAAATAETASTVSTASFSPTTEAGQTGLLDNTRISLILDLLYTDRSNTQEKTIPGFPSGGHSHGLENGLSPGHSEVAITHDFSDTFSLQSSVAILTEENELTAEVEELYLQGTGILPGVNAKAGRFLSDIGYLSSQHTHEWDFTHNPLVYKSLFGGHVYDDGLQLSYLAPTDRYLQIGTGLLKGDDFPAGGSDNSVGAYSLFAKTGGDIGTDHSWLAGIGHYRAADIQRAGVMHGDEEAHEHEHEANEIHDQHDEHEEHDVMPVFKGDSAISGVNFVYKWSPNGNWKQKNFKLQGEYFRRNEKGVIDMLEEDGEVLESTRYKGKQDGWYVAGVYQFMPRWRAGLRYERLGSDNSATDEAILDEAGLHDEGHTPERSSAMIDFSQNHYSRLRLQFTRDESSLQRDDQIILQYTHSFGSHGAHRF